MYIQYMRYRHKHFIFNCNLSKKGMKNCNCLRKDDIIVILECIGISYDKDQLTALFKPECNGYYFRNQEALLLMKYDVNPIFNELYPNENVRSQKNYNFSCYIYSCICYLAEHFNDEDTERKKALQLFCFLIFDDIDNYKLNVTLSEEEKKLYKYCVISFPLSEQKTIFLQEMVDNEKNIGNIKYLNLLYESILNLNRFFNTHYYLDDISPYLSKLKEGR